MLLALALDAVFGWPDRLYRRLGHPVVWIGRLVALCDRRLNRPEWPDGRRRLAGVLTAAVTVGAAALVAALPAMLLGGGPVAVAVTGVLAWPLVAARSLHTHVAAVAAPLAAADLASAREAVSHIVGRDPARLDAPAIARAAIESLAENASDGVAAPILWGAVLGLPGIAAYKAVNTLDSMVGYRTRRHAAFGWASARLDDLANLVPARATAAAFVLVSPQRREAAAVLRRDARRHRSPNAGWPEAAMAGGLGVRLSGPRAYGDTVADEPWVNDGAPDPGPGDIRRALALFRRAVILLALGLAVAAVV
jgi:adenosylcobinamide-phosphate synthase